MRTDGKSIDSASEGPTSCEHTPSTTPQKDPFTLSLEDSPAHGRQLRLNFDSLVPLLSPVYSFISGRSLTIKSLNFRACCVVDSEVTQGYLSALHGLPAELCLKFAVSHQCSKGALCQHVHVPLTACLARDRYILQALHTISEVGLPSEDESLQNWAGRAVTSRQPIQNDPLTLWPQLQPRGFRVPPDYHHSFDDLVNQLENCTPMSREEWRSRTENNDVFARFRSFY